MLKAELHVHSNQSDGRDSVKKLIQRAIELELDVLSITDHDTLNGSLEAIEIVNDEHLPILILPGIEISTNSGHLLAYGIEKEIGEVEMEKAVRRIFELGGISALAHPFQIKRGGTVRVGLFKIVDAIEVFNSKYLIGVCNKLSEFYARKFRKAQIAGSDAHSVRGMGYGITLIDGDRNLNSVVNSLKFGRTQIFGKRLPIRVMLEGLIAKI